MYFAKSYARISYLIFGIDLRLKANYLFHLHIPDKQLSTGHSVYLRASMLQGELAHIDNKLSRRRR